VKRFDCQVPSRGASAYRCGDCLAECRPVFVPEFSPSCCSVGGGTNVCSPPVTMFAGFSGPWSWSGLRLVQQRKAPRGAGGPVATAMPPSRPVVAWPGRRSVSVGGIGGAGAVGLKSPDQLYCRSPFSRCVCYCCFSAIDNRGPARTGRRLPPRLG